MTLGGISHETGRILRRTDFLDGQCQQFRFRKQGESLAIFFEHELLGELEITSGPARLGLKKPDRKNIEMVRVTAL